MSSLPLVPPDWELPEELRLRLGDTAGRQRAMMSEGHLLLVLHAPPKADDDERQGRLFWRLPDGSWRSSDFGPGVKALGTHLNEFAEVLEGFDRLEETASTADEYFAVARPLAPLQRTTRNMYAALQEARQLCSASRSLINYRDRAYDLDRMAELIYQGAKNGLDFAVAKRSEELAKDSHRMAISAHRLNLLVALFFPVATLSSIFGVNFRHGWEEKSAPLPFLIVMGAGIACGMLLMLMVTLGRGSPK